MRTTVLHALLTIVLATQAGAAQADGAWFTDEREAADALSEGATPDVFECIQCDVDDVHHRTTRSFIRRLLEEYAVAGRPARGAFLLRERTRPRFAFDTDGTTASLQAVCSDGGWSPSLTRWDYDLGDEEAVPVATACVPTLAPVTPIRMSCHGCDLDQPQLDAGIREQLEAAHWALLKDEGPVNSGMIFITDSASGGFRRLAFRSYPGRIFLGPANGFYRSVPVGDLAGRLARSP